VLHLEPCAGHDTHDLDLYGLAGSRKALMQIGSGWRDVLAEHLVPNLVIGMHGPFGGVVLIDAYDVRKVCADFGQYLLDIAVEPTRFAPVMRLPAQRPVRLYDLRRKAVDVIRSGLTRGEHPLSRTYPASQPGAGVRDWHRQKGLNGCTLTVPAFA